MFKMENRSKNVPRWSIRKKSEQNHEARKKLRLKAEMGLNALRYHSPSEFRDGCSPFLIQGCQMHDILTLSDKVDEDEQTERRNSIPKISEAERERRLIRKIQLRRPSVSGGHTFNDLPLEDGEIDRPRDLVTKIDFKRLKEDLNASRKAREEYMDMGLEIKPCSLKTYIDRRKMLREEGQRYEV